MQKKIILFLYRGGLHHIYHSLYIAIELSKIQDEYQVCILNTSLKSNNIIKTELKRLNAKVIYFNKSKFFLFINQNYKNIIKLNKKIFEKTDVLITSSFGIPKLLTKFNLRDIFVIFTNHGTGDGKYTFNNDLSNYDCTFITSRKMYEQYKNFGILKTLKTYLIVDYCKFDYLFYNQNKDLKIFNNELPIVLYNPHYNKKISSFYKDGENIVNKIIKSDKYNLILSPHPLVNSWHFIDRIKMKFPKSDNFYKDWSSIHKVNFDYMKIADIYLGDVSSSSYEWLYFNKPMVFFNSYNIKWDENPYYKFWHMGYVINNINDLIPTLDKSLKKPDAYLKIRSAIKDYTFGKIDGKASYHTAKQLYELFKKVFK